MEINTQIPSVIIPAYNEEKIISRCLESLGSGLTRDFQIIVVCNGCTDKTAEVVESSFPNIHLLSLLKGSKSLAIRSAESKKPGFPRIYLDADILLNVEGIKELISIAMGQKAQHLIIPKSHINYNESHHLVKQYYDAWYSTDFVQRLGFGAGTYVLSERARNRFGEWPELIADDGFLRTRFSIDEIDIVEHVCEEVQAPKTLRQLIQIKTRSKLGNKQLKNYLNTAKKERNGKNFKTIKLSLFDIVSWNYFVVNSLASISAWWRYQLGDYSWLRDKSTR
jgi:glycosyltransferase involved in cell wall biosynthesis